MHLACADVLESVPHLSPKIVTFALQHRSSMHDIFLLIQFATDLANSGNKSGALSLFGNLLRLWTGKLDQIAIIKRCLNFCWLKASETDRSASASTPGLRNPHHQPSQAESRQASVDGHMHAAGQAMQSPGSLQQCASSMQSCAIDSAQSLAEPQYDIPAILEFMQHQRGLRATEFVEVLANLGVPRQQLIQVCKGVLARHSPTTYDGDAAQTSDAHVPPSITATPPQQIHSSAYGDLPSTDLGLDGSKDYSGSAAAALGRPPQPSTPLFSGIKAQHSGSSAQLSVTGGAVHSGAAHGSQFSGLLHQPSLTRISNTGDATEQQYSDVTEALALVPRLVEMVEEDVREDSAAKVAAVGRDLTAALGLDLTGVVDVPSMCDTRDGEPAELRLLQCRAAAAAKRRRAERAVAVLTTIGAVLVPGGLGRLLAAVPAIVVLSRS